ncbi:carbohydrate kinase family protein [Prosthecobacter sp.]|uniref:carbohydrate kinase family protein n=1 Tax=Prosthecobacter sp. TaxID=1965333 RepID=UPI001DFB2068|nr:carbohydrate kinase family protein [Prosthecobacter sp.]MCB1275085.1 carbohydrate kinase family protein [Prosthecobacter sp.]
MTSRNGILAGGNFIIDHVKLIDAWPEQDMLAFISSETSSNGGGPYNVLKDLAAMGVSYPLAAVGLVGRDSNGDWILRDCESAGIDITQLQQTDAAPTSYTDAMTVSGSGRRTFFHQLGTNALLGEAHFDFSRTGAKIFHLGYLMLLSEMDRLLPDGRTVASRVLEGAQRAGLITTLDLVSSSNPQFREITAASLPYTDYLIVNEIEAGNATGIDLKGSPPDLEKIQAAARQLLDAGVRREVVIHFEAGAVVVEKGGSVHHQSSLQLPPNFIAGATGSGDAFAAGYLHGTHEESPIAERLRLAVCTAAICLTHPTPSQGLRPVNECLELAAQFGFRH